MKSHMEKLGLSPPNYKIREVFNKIKSSHGCEGESVTKEAFSKVKFLYISFLNTAVSFRFMTHLLRKRAK